MKSAFKKYRELKLYVKIFIFLILGIITGIFWGEGATVLDPVGDIFIRLMKMVIVPVVLFSLIGGVAGMKDAVKLRNIGFKTIATFLLTTACAITIGLIMVNIIQPGANFNMDIPTGTMESAEVPSVISQLVGAVPTNIIQAMADGDMLQIIVFAIFFGIALLVIGEKAQPVINAIDVCANAMYKIIGWVMMLSPYAIFCIMASVCGTFGFAVLIPMAKFLLTMYISVFIHIAVVYSFILKFIAKVNPITFYKKVFEQWLVAFSLCSSSATLPIAMKIAQEKLGVPKEISSFVQPLGATTNMDGSGIYFATVTMFVVQIYGLQFSLGQQVNLLLTAVLMSIGCAAIPNAALVLSVGLLSSLGVPAEPLMIVTGMYRMIDQAETSTNSVGDSMVAVTVSALEKELDLSIYNDPNAGKAEKIA